MFQRFLFTQVAVCAGADSYEPWAALVVGLLGGIIFMASNYMMEKLKIDDPLEAFAGIMSYVYWNITTTAA